MRNLYQCLALSFVIVALAGCGATTDDTYASTAGVNNASGGSDTGTSNDDVFDDVDDEIPDVVATGSIMLTWDAPKFRENGEAVTVNDIGGYKITFINDEAGIEDEVVIEDGALTSTEIVALAVGEWEFKIAAYDSEGVYSAYSEPTTRSIF